MFPNILDMLMIISPTFIPFGPIIFPPKKLGLVIYDYFVPGLLSTYGSTTEATLINPPICCWTNFFLAKSLVWIDVVTNPNNLVEIIGMCDLQSLLELKWNRTQISH